LTPSAFSLYTLVPIDASRSPFLVNADKLYQARRCLISQAPKNDASITRLLNDIDAFLASTNLSAVAEPKPADSKRAGAPQPAPATGSAPAADAAAPSQGVPSSPSHLMAVLAADSFARKLGVDPAIGLLPDNGASDHIPMVKALESGGTIEKRVNILGTKIRYSGGSVGTFAMFTMDGDLECSGNVYEYGGSLPAKDFQSGLRDYVPDPSKQFLLQRGSCATH
jgi:hypothetical protein